MCVTRWEIWGFQYVICCTITVTSGSRSSRVHLRHHSTNTERNSTTPFVCSGWRLQYVCNSYSTKCYLCTGKAWNFAVFVLPISRLLYLILCSISWYMDHGAGSLLRSGHHSLACYGSVLCFCHVQATFPLKSVLSQSFHMAYFHLYWRPGISYYYLIFILNLTIPSLVLNPRCFDNSNSIWYSD